MSRAIAHPAFWTGLAAAAVGASASGQLLMDELPEQVQGVEVIEHLGDQVPADIALYNAEGEAVKLGDYFEAHGGRPIVLAMVYYDCPMLCGLVMTRMQEVFNKVDFNIGEDFQFLVVSFDHTNTTAMAAGQQATYRAGYDRDLTPSQRDLFERSLVFHTTSALNARTLGRALGYEYNYLPEVDEFSHPSAFFVLTPDGKISRYIYGLTYEPRDVKLALLEASDGKIGDSFGDVFLQLCFTWDPSSGAYTLHAMRVMQIAGVGTTVLLAGGIGVLFLAERRRRRQRNRTDTTKTDPRSAGAPVMGVTA